MYTFFMDFRYAIVGQNIQVWVCYAVPYDSIRILKLNYSYNQYPEAIDIEIDLFQSLTHILEYDTTQAKNCYNQRFS